MFGQYNDVVYSLWSALAVKLAIGILSLFTGSPSTERNRRSGRQHPMSTRRMVALYDYDPRESSPNVDVEVLSSVLEAVDSFTFYIISAHIFFPSF